MCVIYACGTELPPYDELSAGATGNRDGAGVAWLEGDKVKWIKGLESDADAVLKAIKEHNVQFPCVIHFRIASVGGKDLALTHPFPITRDVSLDLEGESESVLFHNGHIHNWDDYVFRAGLATDVPYPLGPWSDTRGLAWLVYLKGTGVLRFTSGSSRVCILSPVEGATSGWDNLDLYGEWEDAADEKQGWLASTSTRKWVHTSQYTSAAEGRSCEIEVIQRGAAYTPAEDRKSDANSSVANTDASAPYIWTLEELHELLGTMEEELHNARLAAGLEG